MAVRPNGECPPRLAIATYLQNRDEPTLNQRLAEQSSLPLSNLHQSPEYHGMPRSEQNTSLMLTSCDHTRSGTPSQELPGVTRGTSEATPESITASLGERQLAIHQRSLENGPGGTLVIPPLPAQQILECPFNLLFCCEDFSSLEDWVQHSLTHFGSCPPSPCNVCCFCDAVFKCSTGRESWKKRMIHVSLHHRLGHRLAYARPDFELFTYMWRNRLISTADYRDLKGNSEDRSRAATAHPAPFVSPNERSRAHTETYRNPRLRYSR